ncbi:alpha-1,6-glucosidases, pullulanase-type [Asanoa hainanensis]|uniref:Alpha-1,6-glucosidases, pullulanase-type n=1 Tax=Asanoa hainanensis TaxID=560556 RepID=A0A239PB13_9ACTN|nr:pullulanase-type alpha-1,6-glucosidase [Asanoa hainanensis]SNT64250.1 alpha-1,6-glucosidases, pullulanase-type [Asanoa hainanensis]
MRPRWRFVVVAVFAVLASLVGAPAFADHTPLPSQVTLVGSLQSELGCPGDWQPECAQTALAPVAGSPGLFRASFTVPAGAFEYKVALNGSWDENYGAGGAPGGANIPLTAPGGLLTFTYDHATHRIVDDAPRALGAESAAHWVRRDVIAWQPPASAVRFALYTAPSGGMIVDDGAVVGGSAHPLGIRAAGLPDSVRRDYPHLAAMRALTVPSSVPAASVLTGQLAVAAFDAAGVLVDATGVQIPGVLDDLYAGAARRTLGVSWSARGVPSFALWAPTAQSVSLLVDGVAPIVLRRDRDGIWSTVGSRSWRGLSYVYSVQVFAPTTGRVETNLVTDPYSVALTADSTRSVLASLSDPSLTPPGWAKLRKPAASPSTEAHVYELHVRDFSIGDTSVPAAHRGTYAAFTDRSSAGMRHLRSLASAGVSHLHLLPVFDFATVPEARSAQQVPACDLAALPPASEQQQACVEPVRPTDGFNWGYDPWHYTTPEGSYAVDPAGAARTREFRSMVAGINGAGLRVVMDVVYNHTTASGQAPKSVLDRIVPGYYQRLTLTGQQETSTCCANTATEHRMMEKLMVDSVVTWARDYKVDGFRFDLMGHHSKANMLAVRHALDKLSLARDGVDGRSILLYGEGWNFGEVANDARFVQATQANMAGTGIATFSDRLRDAVRGGGPFDENPHLQGFGSGLFTDPNGDPVNGDAAAQLARLLLTQDQIKVGLAGNLRSYRFQSRTGAVVSGAEVDYNGQPAGYAASPADTVTYVDAHDNETLFDNLQYKLPQSLPMADRVRMNTLSLATTTLSQGVGFWHAGTDLLRSKSLDRNSYDSGDWFNRIDWSGASSTWGSGLPPRGDNEAKWSYQRPLLADPALKPTPADMAAAASGAADFLRIAGSSPLFALPSAAEIQRRVSFPLGGPDQTPGVIVMVLDDTAGKSLDRRWDRLVVVFNASPTATTQVVPGASGRSYALHPVQAGGSDPVVKTARYTGGGAFTVPGRSVAVFVS